MAAEQIHMNEGNTAGIMVPLIPFNCIIDSDFGLLSLISSKYRDPKFFNLDFLDSHSKIKDLVLALYERKEQNPLSLIMANPDDKDTANDLYIDFMDKMYTDILDRSMATDICKLAIVYEDNNIHPTILCKRQEEVDFISTNSTIHNLHTELIREDGKVNKKDISAYQQFFFKFTNDRYCQLLADYIFGKVVYLSNYDYNDTNTDIWNTILATNRNEFKRIDFYNKDKLKGVE